MRPRVLIISSDRPSSNYLPLLDFLVVETITNDEDHEELIRDGEHGMMEVLKLASVAIDGAWWLMTWWTL